MGMPHPMPRGRPTRLERSCTAPPVDWIRIAPPQPGFERLEAFFAGHGYEPHRHDTYAIGVTLHGVQSFGYRGATAHSLRGQVVVLHPDEVHDGRAGTDAGFRYRMAYIEPGLMQEALGEPRRPLPFARDPVSDDARLIAAIAPALDDLEAPLEDLQRDQVLAGLAAALAAVDRTGGPIAIGAACFRAVAEARYFLDSNIGQVVRSEALEAVTGLSRFALARHFRACLGTSPYRYLVMRRLDRARHMMRSGAALAETAAACGFADQSHMTRQFKKAYGIAPGRWQQAAGLFR
jgi:AraC-like DNA-binding protein